MRAEKFSEAMNVLDDKYIERAINYQAKKHKPMWIKWASVAACLCLFAMVGFGLRQRGIIGDSHQKSGGEFRPTESYVYEVDEGLFSAYVRGKVIAEDKIGERLSDVTLTAGWKNEASNEWISQEKLRGEVYSIDGIDNKIAVALKFTDKGDAVTTTHYYVIMNPAADLSVLEAYIIPPYTITDPEME